MSVVFEHVQTKGPGKHFIDTETERAAVVQAIKKANKLEGE